MEFRQYTDGDMEKIWRKDLIEELGFTSNYFIDLESTWTAFDNDQIIGIGGFRKYWQGVYECWIMVKSPEAFYKYKIQISKLIFDRIANLHFHRIQASVLAVNELDNRFIKFLGFQKEALLHQYGPDKQDYYLYSLVK